MREFTALKFRTMRVDTDDSDAPEFIEVDDELQCSAYCERSVQARPRGLRHTVRRLAPQHEPRRATATVNVLRGDMSLVGPSPCLPYETENFEPHHFERFLVPAGLTGLWQVTARARCHLRRSARYGCRYARSWSLGLDLKLLLRTPFVMIRPKVDGLMAVWEGHDFAPVRTAVIGLGYWGPNLVRNLHELPDADLVTVCDLREDALVKVALRYPAVRTTTRFEEVLEDETIEAF